MAAGQINPGFGGAGKEPLGSILTNPEEYPHKLELVTSSEGQSGKPGRLSKILAAIGLRGTEVTPPAETANPSSLEQPEKADMGSVENMQFPVQPAEASPLPPIADAPAPSAERVPPTAPRA